ncbi:TPA: glutaredoxin [Legionella pneumophila]|uniref:Glutaredoxin 1 n=1 Tax=Legionella bozemanae TaxID=447 RepID=A0A0W0RBM5_LEGBO|nr:glutaredoxin domain-containing protein [Legionella bozemanae]KTC68421.1 glutaredoxin 1 [Legionella bozemanae]STP13901.1 glutaredoxin 1 [Legionella bozemanae]HAT1722157.1 glutaredoxin [Legionella pneumophila]
MSVKITLYRWEGQYGPFKIKVPCGECSLTKDIILDAIATDLKDIPVELDIHAWLNEWWKPLLKGAWHAPIVLVEGKVISQGHALNRGVLTQAVIEAHAKQTTLTGNHIFGKTNCIHCQHAKQYFEEAKLSYEFHDVVKNPRDLYEMLARVKPIVGAKTPITVPQIWLDSQYVGGAEELSAILGREVEPNPERGICSLTAKGHEKN